MKITRTDFQGLTKEMNLGKNIFLAALEIGYGKGLHVI